MPMLPDLADRINALITEFGIPGATVAIRHGDDYAEAAAGVVNRNTGVTTTPDSVFQIGSITKLFTTVLILQLVDEGLVELDAPVRAYLPGFAVADPIASATVTVRHLLSHTGGFDGDLLEDFGRGDDALGRFIAFMASATQFSVPGEMFSYCNSGFCALGAIVDRLRSSTWEGTMRERLIAPLGLTRMSLFPEEAILFRASAGHLRRPGAEADTVAPVWSMPRSNAPAGSTPTASARDLVRFAGMLMAGGVGDNGTRVLSADAIAAMLTPQTTVPSVRPERRGLGTMLFDWNGTGVYGHDGRTAGHQSSLRIVPDHDLAIAVLANGSKSSQLFDALIPAVVEELTGVVRPARPVPPATPSRVDVTPYTGRFAGPLLSYVVTAAGDGIDVTTVPTEIAIGLGETETTEHWVHRAGDAFIRSEPDAGLYATLKFVDDRKFLFIELRAIPRVG